VRFVITVVSAALLLCVLYLIAGWFVDGYFGGDIVPDRAVPDAWAAPNSWNQWRDIVIVFIGLFWLVAGVLLVVLLAALIFLALTARRLLRENVAPAVDSFKETLDNVRGTTEVVGEQVVSPIIRVYSVVKGVRTGISAVTNLPDRIRGRRKKKGKK
jgi:hypothetical protein